MNTIAPHPFEHAPDEHLDPPDVPSAVQPPTPPVAPFQPIAIAARADGWTPDRQRQFIEELADCGVVREAAARVGMSEQGAYQQRRRPDAAGFNQAWDTAVRLGVHRLHSTAFERAVSGTVKPRFFRGEIVGEEKVFDNRLLIYLLGRLDKHRDYDAEYTARDWHGTMEALDQGLLRPLPAPDVEPRSPVWRNTHGEWCTSFMPPDGFDGHQWGAFGDKDYCRTLTEAELEAVEARRARLAKKAGLQRDRYFARLAHEV